MMIDINTQLKDIYIFERAMNETINKLTKQKRRYSVLCWIFFMTTMYSLLWSTSKSKLPNISLFKHYIFIFVPPLISILFFIWAAIMYFSLDTPAVFTKRSNQTLAIFNIYFCVAKKKIMLLPRIPKPITKNVDLNNRNNNNSIHYKNIKKENTQSPASKLVTQISSTATTASTTNYYQNGNINNVHCPNNVNNTSNNLNHVFNDISNNSNNIHSNVNTTRLRTNNSNNNNNINNINNINNGINNINNTIFQYTTNKQQIAS